MSTIEFNAESTNDLNKISSTLEKNKVNTSGPDQNLEAHRSQAQVQNFDNLSVMLQPFAKPFDNLYE